jgi:hypothetical protein
VRREHKILVSLDGSELARLDELRPSGTARAVFLRQLLQGPSAVKEAPSHAEAVAILARLARDGKVAAAVALERALRDDAGAGGPEGELERLLRGD